MKSELWYSVDIAIFLAHYTKEMENRMMNMPYNTHILSVDRYISEVQDLLLEHVLQAPKSLILAPMGTGKTTFLEKCVVPAAKGLNKWVVFVIPGVSQLREMKLRAIETVCEGADCSGDRMFYATTPDSLHKVMNKAYELGKSVWLVVDEAHACVTSSKFRKVFLQIDKFAQKTEKVIRMTATSKPLEGMELGPIFEIQRKYNTPVKLTLQPVKKVDADTIYKVASERYVQGEVLFTHYNNIKENKLLAEKLSQLIEKEEEKVILQESKQLSFDDDGSVENTELAFKMVDKTNKAVSLNAKNKDHAATQSLIQGEMPQDVAIMSMTSFIKEGMNILNDKLSTVVIVWDDTLTDVELIQTIGRYRLQENIKEVIVIVQEYTKQDIDYKPFETLLEAPLSAEDKMLDAIRTIALTDKAIAEDYAKGMNIIWDETINDWKICKLSIRNRVYNNYSGRLRKSLHIAKKELEANKAINLKVTIADTLEEPEDKSIAEEVKILKENEKAEFEELINEMLKLDDLTIKDILEHTVSGSRPELREAMEKQELFHSLVPTKFKEALKELIKYEEIDKVEAFRRLVTSGKKNYKPLIEQAQTIMVNRTIQREGLEVCKKKFEILRRNKETEIVPRIVFIRDYLKEAEKKRGRLTTKLKRDLAEQLIREGYYGHGTTIRKISKQKDPSIQQILESECKHMNGKEKVQYANQKHTELREKLLAQFVRDNLDKATKKLNQDLNNIYSLYQERITSLNT